MKFLSGTKASLIFLGAMALLLGATTFVERYAGSGIASFLYHNPLTIALWGLLLVNWLLIWRRIQPGRKVPLGSTILHLSFAVMLTGAFVTMVTDTEGSMHLEAGDIQGKIIRRDGRTERLPFTVCLDSLKVSRYPGTGNPSGFTSYVTITKDGVSTRETVSVNHPLRVKGWRIYQSSYTPETNGSIFSLAHDPWGTTISYIGYVLLLISFIMLMFSPDSRFSHLRKQLAGLGCAALLLFAASPGADAAESIDWDGLAVQDSRGRIVTMDSFCRELMRKIHHDESWTGMGAIESVLSLMADPYKSFAHPFIYQKNKEVAAAIGQESGRYASLSSLFSPDGDYKLADLIDKALAVPSQQRSRFQKDILKLDEKANLLYALIALRQMPLFPKPDSEGKVWLTVEDDLSALSREDVSFIMRHMEGILTAPSQSTVDAICRYQRDNAGSVLPRAGQVRQEILCNRIKPFKAGAMGYMSCALLLMVCSLLLRRGGKLQNISCIAILTVTAMVSILHTWGIAARWYCSGQPPLSNSYEVTVFMSWCVALMSLVLSRRSTAASAFGILFSGALLLVAGMNNVDPAVTPLVPVLQSPWLMFHVAVIMAGYACFGINFMLSIYGLGTIGVCGEDSVQTRRIAILTEIFAMIGLMLMTIGTFLGAVWAGESWGSYWSWDPKETWALVTILVYTICTHSRLVPKLNRPHWLFILSIAGMACVLMTYFGVNYFLVGMHSYAS